MLSVLPFFGGNRAVETPWIAVYYLENGEVVSVAIRSNMLEYSENEEEIYTYYLSDWDTSVEKEEWEKAVQTFQTGKKALDVSVCWKDLYETEISEKKVLGWFLLLAESLDGADERKNYAKYCYNKKMLRM